jgi:prepilin-type N-terminal cleavage/methylation domain-containing protein/prepilin-type processing-associated H-X9-DG protein
MKTRKNAFTLIELLVVISIIALLVSILLPALSSARDQAKMAVCSVHISGIGKAVTIYTTDYKDILPSWNFRKTAPVGEPLDNFIYNQSIANYYVYCHQPEYGANAGPHQFGCLYLSGALENMSNVVFCPSFRNVGTGGYSGQGSSHGREYDAWNSKGDPTHWNYCGINSTNGYFLTPGDASKIGWLNYRVSYGIRALQQIKIKSIAKTKSSTSYVSDVWLATPSMNAFYRSHIDEISHVSRGSTEAKMHAWYCDGHVERRNFPREKYFISSSASSSLQPSEGGFFNYFPTITWRVLFDDGIDDSTGMPYNFAIAK